MEIQWWLSILGLTVTGQVHGKEFVPAHKDYRPHYSYIGDVVINDGWLPMECPDEWILKIKRRVLGREIITICTVTKMEFEKVKEGDFLTIKRHSKQNLFFN